MHRLQEVAQAATVKTALEPNLSRLSQNSCVYFFCVVVVVVVVVVIAVIAVVVVFLET